jgi:hypothetical protein
MLSMDQLYKETRAEARREGRARLAVAGEVLRIGALRTHNSAGFPAAADRCGVKADPAPGRGHQPSTSSGHAVLESSGRRG